MRVRNDRCCQYLSFSMPIRIKISVPFLPC
nr:MAG TPA: hypothetical protein [Caudoviricetes sp.]